MIHFHKFELLEKNARGYFQKQKGQRDSKIVIAGSVFKCVKCPKMILKPSGGKLLAVEVTYDIP